MSDAALTEATAALEGLRVLDLTGPLGVYCGKLLADLGADVIRIEPPCGDDSRRLGPFYEDEPGLERSLFHWHFNAGKRGITLDPAVPDGKDVFLRLARGADIVLESFRPGHLEGCGLGYEALRGINQRLILTSITSFGQTGPYRDYAGGELAIQALSGLLWISGWGDRPPVMMGGNAALHQGSAEAAAATLIALECCEQTGKGQHVDVSLQACLQAVVGTTLTRFYLTGEQPQPARVAGQFRAALNGLFACKDGYVDLRFRGRPGQWERLRDWMDAAGMASGLTDECWRDHDFRSQPEHMDFLHERFLEFTLTLTREEVMDTLQRCGIEVGAVYTAEDVAGDRQLQARHFFVEVEHQELGRSFTYPGAPYVLSDTPWRLRRRAPLLGEHNLEIYGTELGISTDDLVCLRAAGAI